MSYIDRERRVRFANQAGIDWNTETPADAIGRHIGEIFDPAALEVIVPEIDRALAGEKRTYERLARPRHGDARWVRVHLIPDFALDGSVAGLYTLMIDVDDDRRLRDALELKEAQLRSFAENIPGPIAMVNADFRYVFANKVFQHLRGVSLDEIVGRRVRDVLGDDAAQYFDPFVARLQRGETCTYERLSGPPGGEQRWHSVRLAPIMDAEGAFNGYYIVGHDIHDLKMAEARTREQEAQLRLYTDNIPDAVAYLDRDRRVLFANRHFAEQRGTTPEAIIGRTTAELVGEGVAEWIRTRTQAVLDRGETVTYERETLAPDGGRRWLHVKAVPDLDESRRVRGMYVVAHDISEVKEAQAEANRAHVELEDKERQLRQVIDSIPTPMCYVDTGNRYRYVNDAFLRYIGLPAERIVGHSVHDVLGEERWQLMAPILDRVRAGESLAVERLVRFADGASRWMTVRLTPRIADGRYQGYYATTSDIHEQKMVEQELRRAHTIVSAHFDNTPLAVSSSTPTCASCGGRGRPRRSSAGARRRRSVARCRAGATSTKRTSPRRRR
jgi:PAS domain S-box-containing protein